LKDWIIRKAFKNFGKVKGLDVYRSGQPDLFRVKLLHKLYKFKTVVNLAYSPDYDPQDDPEAKYFKQHDVTYLYYRWGAGGPPTPEAVPEVVRLMINMKAPLWIHCEGGKDRTGGLVAYLQRTCGSPWDDVVEQWCLYGIPAPEWIEFVVKLLP